MTTINVKCYDCGTPAEAGPEYGDIGVGCPKCDIDPRFSDVFLRAAASELTRLQDGRIGADAHNPGMYAVYFYDREDNEIRSVGKFPTVRAASRAVPFIKAEAILERVAQEEADRV